MPRNVLTIKDLGEEACWTLVQQALGIPDAKMQSDFMVDRVAILMFLRQSLPERLCVSAAVRQMGGSTIFQGDPNGVWLEEVNDFQEHLLPIFGYYLDCMYIYGFHITDWAKTDILRFPLINAGSPDAHPAHALADIACMLRCCRYLKGVQAAWIGCDNGTLHSLVEAMAWFPFELRVFMPRQIDSEKLRERVASLKVPVTFVSSKEEAVSDARFIFAGCRGKLVDNELSALTISSQLMGKARPDARLMLSASPVRAIPVEPEVLASTASLLVRQAEYRLRIHKRILHWVFAQ